MTRRRTGVVTPGARLVAEHTDTLRRWVAQGGRVVVAHGRLLRSLGFSRSDPLSVDRAVMGDDTAVWPRPEQVRPLRATARLAGFQPFATAGDAALVAAAELDRGAVLGVAVDPIGRGEGGYERFPSLGRLVATWTAAPSGPARYGAEVYVDGSHVADAAALARLMSPARAVHVARPYADGDDPSAGDTSRRIVDALHAEGVLAYAWLEPITASASLWEEHPECRQRTAAGEDALDGGRRLVALEDPACLELAWRTWEPTLTAAPWDGVTVGRLSFESADDGDAITPFSPAALSRFGGDPATDREGFRRFRADLVVELHREVLRRVNGLPRAAGMAFQVAIGGDGDGAWPSDHQLGLLAAVAAEHGALVQVREPPTARDAGPQRFSTVATKVAALTPTGQGFVGLSVADRPGARPTAQLSGGELDLTVMAAAQASGRVAVYPPGNGLRKVDVDHLPGALGGGAAVFDSGVRTAGTVAVSAPGGAAYGRLRLDGKDWPAGPGHAVVPAGEHRLDWARGAPEGPTLSRITGELGTASVKEGVMTLTYDSRPPALAVVSPRPSAVLIDGVAAAPTIAPRPSGGYVVSLPPGTHTVEMRYGDTR